MGKANMYGGDVIYNYVKTEIRVMVLKGALSDLFISYLSAIY